ncbi:MAG: glycosyltransferase family 9 protein [Pyrinomonadaceae bacterium]
MNSPPTNAAPKKILVYLFGSLGDNIVAIPAMRAVRRYFSNAEIVVLQNVQAAMPVRAEEVIPPELANRYLTYTSDVGSVGNIWQMFRLWRRIRQERSDAAVYLVTSERPEKSVNRDLAFFRRCGIKDLYGFHAFSKADLFPVDAAGRPAEVPHEAERRLDRIARDGIPTEENDLATPLVRFQGSETEEMVSWLAGHRQRPAARLVALAPGCKTKANQWPEENFSELVRRLDRDDGIEIVLVGGQAEVETARRLGLQLNATGELSVRQSGALLSLCDGYIGLDTGSTHLAAAAGTPCFSIYGERNNQGQWFPLGISHMTLFHPTECAGCRYEVCPISDHPCIRGIGVDDVWPHLQEFFSTLGTERPSRVISV